MIPLVLKRTLSIVVAILISLSAWGNLKSSFGADTIVINLMVVNGSEEKKQFPVKYALPKGVQPFNIANAAGLSLEYEVNQDTYFLTGKVSLGPKESRILRVEVDDIWQVKNEEVDVLKQQLSDNLELLQGTEFYEGARLIHDRIVTQLDYVLAQQDRYSENIERRIEQYESYKEVLDNIRNNAFSLDYLRRQSQLDGLDPENVMRFVIEAENRESTSREISHRHYLPQEIKEADIIDGADFEIRYDEQRQQHYLSKKETLAPGEKKRYEIIVKDVWALSESLLANLSGRADLIAQELTGSIYKESSDFLHASIERNLALIRESAQDKDDIRQYIGAYRANQKPLQQIKDDVQKLEGMLAVVNAQKMAELSGDAGMLQRLRSLSGISTVSMAIFGSAPSLTMTWKIILGIMVFLALFTTVHFLTWWKRSQVMGEGSGIKPGESFKDVLKGGAENRKQ